MKKTIYCALYLHLCLFSTTSGGQEPNITTKKANAWQIKHTDREILKSVVKNAKSGNWKKVNKGINKISDKDISEFGRWIEDINKICTLQNPEHQNGEKKYNHLPNLKNKDILQYLAKALNIDCTQHLSSLQNPIKHTTAQKTIEIEKYNPNKPEKFIKYLLQKKDFNKAARIASYVTNEKIKTSLIKEINSELDTYNSQIQKNEFNSTIERIMSLKKIGQDKQALDLLENTQNLNGYDIKKDWKAKDSYARHIMYTKQNKFYNKMASIVENTAEKLSGADLINAQWTLGWLNLHFINNPKEALKLFIKMNNNATKPISISRSSYWIARTYETLNQPEKAKLFYQKAAEHNSAFYGQLSLIALKNKYNLKITDKHRVKFKEENFFQNKSFKIMNAASQIGEFEIARILLDKSIRTPLDRQSIVLMSSIALGNGVNNEDHILKPSDMQLNFADPSLIMSIINKESSFKYVSQSQSGALGMMQIMPNTAREVAQKLNMEYNEQLLIYDMNYNMKLGINYIEQIIKKAAKCSSVLGISMYNAGQGNVRKWENNIGNPNEMSSMDEIVNWIESIPFPETKEYVMRVLENSYMYNSSLFPQKSAALVTEEFEKKLLPNLNICNI